MLHRPKYVIGMLLMLASLGTGCHSTPGSAPMTKADGFLSSTQLSSSFDNNETLSDSLYLYKVLSVHGTIQKIVRRESGSYVITLDSRTPCRTMVDCTLDSIYNSRYLPLNDGDSITLRGTCAGRLLNVLLMECIIEK